MYKRFEWVFYKKKDIISVIMEVLLIVNYCMGKKNWMYRVLFYNIDFIF